jgi:Predicted protease
MGRFPGTNRLNLAIGLPLRNEEALDNLLQQIYDPASPNFRQYLTPEQFTEKFGPTEQDYQALAVFMKANGFDVTVTHPNRVVLDVNGSVADIERVFHVTMRTYPHPKENRMFYAPDAEPSVDVAVPILHVSGLDNFELPHPKLKIEPAAQTAGMTPNAGSGPGNATWATIFARLMFRVFRSTAPGRRSGCCNSTATIPVTLRPMKVWPVCRVLHW